MRENATHALKLYANWKHPPQKYGDEVMHLWFDDTDEMEAGLDIAIEREDIAYIDVIDIVNNTTTRRYTRCAV